MDLSRLQIHDDYGGNVASGSASQLNGHQFNYRQVIIHRPRSIRAGHSKATGTRSPSLPCVKCSKCPAKDIASSVHFHCDKCEDGHFNLCIHCYRRERGCYHWAPFPKSLFVRKSSEPEASRTDGDVPFGQSAGKVESGLPHTLIARKFILKTQMDSSLTGDDRCSRKLELQQGLFCDSCGNHCNDLYWHCQLCLGGAWGFCNTCIQQERHCTHWLHPIKEASVSDSIPSDAYVKPPHLHPDTYAYVNFRTKCDRCNEMIASRGERYHCDVCDEGDFDMCTRCLHSMQKKDHFPQQWVAERRCLAGHRMVLLEDETLRFRGQSGGVTYESQLRKVIEGKVGGFRSPAEPSSVYAATHNYFPGLTETSENLLRFPRGAEITEVTEINAELAVGVYCGRTGEFPLRYTIYRGPTPLDFARWF